ncbi:J domain-containing protein [Patescibacteria group bacterium]|nr:J domain-containing protein [Patescibacteria group bacterium]
MDAFTKSLKMALGQGSTSWDINPLIVIGLTEAMLDLRLSEDQMYAAVHSYVRQLASQVHPDRTQSTNVSEERRRQIFDAFEILDDRGKFLLALAEFRSLKSSDRNEVNILRGALHTARERLNAYQGKEVYLSQGASKLTRQREEFEKEEKKRRQVEPNLRAEVSRLTRRVKRSEKAAADREKKYNKSVFYVTSLGSSKPVQPINGAVHVFDAQWVAITSLVSARIMKNDSSLLSGQLELDVLDESSRFELRIRKVLKSIGASEAIAPSILKRWADCAAKVGTAEFREFRTNYCLRLSMFEISAGRPKFIYGWDKAITGRILGSLPPDGVEIVRRQLTNVVERETTLETMSPYLVPGGLLVFQSKRNYTGEEGRDTVVFDSKQIILGVG